MRVGLCLGAGGVVGAAWLIGALEALADETGWDPTTADHVVGTSAGSVVGALVADGIGPQVLGAYAAGRTLDDVGELDARVAALAERLGGRERLDELADEVSGDGLRLKLAPPPIGPGSWRLALSTLRAPWRHAPSAVLAGWLPRGFISTDPISALVETFIGHDWPDHPNYWAVAADYCTGRRVAFGREDAPRARVSEAVAASCAIPGFYHPPRIEGRRYVDGGVCSMSNLDLFLGADVDLVVCLNPMSSMAEAMGGTPAERIGALIRGVSTRRLDHEARKLREAGTELLVLQPSAEDIKGMGLNMMARGRRAEVLECARRTTALALRELRGTDALLPERTRRDRRRRPSRTTVARAAAKAAAA